MARLAERDCTYFTTVRGMCRSCREIVPARVFLRDGNVWQESLCPRHANAPALIAADGEWYLAETLRPRPDRAPLPGAHPPRLGCPRDCGPCTWHASSCQLPVVSVTNVCNLECPICFTYNRPERPWHMPVGEMRELVDRLVERCGPLDLINITGGEPTMHPELLDLVECCRRAQIGRVTVNSNGLRLAEDPALCARLGELGACVILSLHTLDPEASVSLHGRDLVAAKLRAVENLTRAGVRMTLLNVMARGVNETAAGGLLQMMRDNDLILSLTVQTMTYTGRGGGRFPDRRHIPVDEAAALVAAGSDGQLAPGDFVSRPVAHPLCYRVCYLLKSGEELVPFTRLADRGDVETLLADGYLIRPGETAGFFRRAIDGLYARGERRYDAALRGLLERVYPPRPLGVFERQRAAESAVRTVYVHAHMDEDNFDCSRAMSCPDLVASSDGRLVPACTYNLFYRMEDERFYAPTE